MGFQCGCGIHLWVYLGVVTFGVQLGSVLGETLEADLLPQQVEELLQGGAGCLVVVHFLLSVLPRSAVHHTHLHLKTQLDIRQSCFTVELFRKEQRRHRVPMCYSLTPCSSSFISCSVTLGVLRASLRQDRSNSGRRYSSTSLMGSPRVVPCLVVEGTASSSIEPRSVVSWNDRNEGVNKLQTYLDKHACTDTENRLP